LETKPYVYAIWIVCLVLAILGFGGWMAGLVWPSIGPDAGYLIIGYYAIFAVFSIQDEPFQAGVLVVSGVFSMVLWSCYHTWHSPWYLVTPLWLAQALLLMVMVYAWLFPDQFLEEKAEAARQQEHEEAELDSGQEIAY
jgi:hypothetical protein